MLAAACMGLSSLSVIASSLWLKRYRKPLLAEEYGSAVLEPPPGPLTGFFERHEYALAAGAREEENQQNSPTLLAVQQVGEEGASSMVSQGRSHLPRIGMPIRSHPPSMRPI